MNTQTTLKLASSTDTKPFSGFVGLYNKEQMRGRGVLGDIDTQYLVLLDNGTKLLRYISKDGVIVATGQLKAVDPTSRTKQNSPVARGVLTHDGGFKVSIAVFKNYDVMGKVVLGFSPDRPLCTPDAVSAF